MSKIFGLALICYTTSIRADKPLTAILFFVIYLLILSIMAFVINILIGLIFLLIYISAISINFFAVISLIGYSLLVSYNDIVFVFILIASLFFMSFVDFNVFYVLLPYPTSLNTYTHAQFFNALYLDFGSVIILLSIYFLLISILVTSQHIMKFYKSSTTYRNVKIVEKVGVYNYWK